MTGDFELTFFLEVSDTNYSSRYQLFSVSLWALIILLFVIFVSTVDYTFHDPDSQLYSKLGQELSAQPLKSWVAPRWVAYSGVEAYFREHPAGAIWVNAALIRIGVPDRQAAATSNLLYFLVAFLFVFKIGRYCKDSQTGWGMVWASFLIPISFQYIVRGNLEPPLTMAAVLGMYGIMRAHEKFGFKLLFAVALVVAVFFKGLQGGYVGLVGGLFWLLVERDRQRFYTLLSSAVALIVVMLLYEWIYHFQTGEEFWLYNFRTQAVAAVQTNAILQKPYNLIWYLARALFFALPWSIFLIAGLRNAKERAVFPNDKRWFWIMSSAAALILIMSLFDRRADRYIFTSYYLIAMGGGWYMTERFSNVKKWVSANPYKLQICFALSILVAAMLKVIISMNFYSNIQFWRN